MSVLPFAIIGVMSAVVMVYAVVKVIMIAKMKPVPCARQRKAPAD